MRFSVGSGYEIKVIDPKTGKIVDIAKKKNDLMVNNMIQIAYGIFKGGSITLTDTSNQSKTFEKVLFTESGGLAPSGNTDYGVIIGKDSSVSVNDYAIYTPLTGSEWSYGACTKYTNTCSSSGWCNQFGVERKITYLGSTPATVSCIGLISKIGGKDTSGNDISSYFLLLKDLTNLTVNPGYILDAKVYITLNPLG